MPRFIHFSDIHIGYENYGRIDPKSGIHERVLDFLKVFDQICSDAVKKKVDFVLFTGDAFRDRTPTPTHQREFAKRIRRLLKEGIPVVLLVGNHDVPAASKAHALSIYEALEISGVEIVDEAKVLHIGGVQVACLPWLRRDHLVRMEELEKSSIEQIRSLEQEKLDEILEELAKKIDPSKPAILAAHYGAEGALFSSEALASLGSDLLLRKESLTKSPFSYIGLGHIHRYQVLSDKPLIVIAGSPERIDFSEVTEDKGYVLVELRDSGAEHTFVPLPVRAMVEIKLDLTEKEGDPTTLVLQEIARRPIADAIVKLSLTLDGGQVALLREKALSQALESAFAIAGIHKITREGARLTGQPVEVATFSFLEWFDRYTQAKGISQAQARKLRQKASSLLDELGLG